MELKRRYKLEYATLKTITIVIVLMAIVISMAGCAQPDTTRTDTSREGIRISFKLDPRLLGPTYGGERWVSPGTYGPIFSSEKTYQVDARAVVLDVNGKSLSTTPMWTPENPAMITVSPDQGGQVTIFIQEAGESRVEITARNLLKTLLIKAEYMNNVIQVEIVQGDESG